MTHRRTSTSSSASVRRAHAVPVSHHLRSRRREVAAWSLAQGTPVDRDALAAVLGSIDGRAPSTAPERWTTGRIAGLLWEGVLGWCRANGVGPPPPTVVRSTLVTYLRFLAAHQLLAPGSDRPAQLRRAVAEHGRTRGESARSQVGRRRTPAPVTPIA
ncbi:MAG: hypothetical protein KGR17_05070 [Acidobacteria bacterium]|nr:hypothetical protein [Acidobacteriota bacterium]